LETKIVSLKRNTPRLFNADEKFWSNVKYVIFYNTHIEIKLKRGRSANYLRDGFFQALQDPSQLYTEHEKLSIYKEYGCAYRFPKESESYLSSFYNAAEKRGLIEPRRNEIASETINKKVAKYREENESLKKKSR